MFDNTRRYFREDRQVLRTVAFCRWFGGGLCVFVATVLVATYAIEEAVGEVSEETFRLVIAASIIGVIGSFLYLLAETHRFLFYVPPRGSTRIRTLASIARTFASIGRTRPFIVHTKPSSTRDRPQPQAEAGNSLMV